MTAKKPCPTWQGRPAKYQAEAARLLFVEGRTVQPWHWVSTHCGNDLCVDPDHMLIEAPHRLRYPSGVCVYCGMPAWTRDHLLPVSHTGRAARRYVLTVPSCGQCNSMIGDSPTPNITERRKIAHKALRRKYRSVLAVRDWSSDELADFGPTMRGHIVRRMAEKAEVVGRLDWPDDPAFDLRALQQSGIEDPWSSGLLGEVA